MERISKKQFDKALEKMERQAKKMKREIEFNQLQISVNQGNLFMKQIFLSNFIQE